MPISRTFATFGYAVLRKVLTDDECQSIAREFARAFQQAFPDLPARRTPAWLPGLAHATPCSAALAVDDGRLWSLSEELLGCETVPCPPEVGWLQGITPWHYDDPLGLPGVKFLAYVIGPSAGLRLLPMSHTSPQREVVGDFLDTSGRTRAEAVEMELMPSVPITLAPGDVVAIDLHVWHCYQVREPRILWAPEYLAWPIEPDSREEKFASVASAGTTEDAGTEWPVWRDWLNPASLPGNRRRAIDLLHRAGAFEDDRHLR